MDNKIAVITGATGGIGRVICKYLIENDYTVYAACRNEKKGKELQTDSCMTIIPADLKSFASVGSFCKEVISSLPNGTIDLLINNAGMIAPMYEVTEDGYESSMQVNYLSAKLITETLLPYITGKIINTISCTVSRGDYKEPVKVKMEPAKKQSTIMSLKHYSNSKLMLTYYTIELHRRVGKNIGVYGADPGIVNTSIISMHRWYDPIADLIFRPFIKSPEQGALPLLNAIKHSPDQSSLHREYPLLFAGKKIREFPKKILSLI